MRALLRVWPRQGFWGSRPTENLWLAVQDNKIAKTVAAPANQVSPPESLRAWAPSYPDYALEIEVSNRAYELLKRGQHYAQRNPIPDMPGGSVSGCIDVMKRRKGKKRGGRKAKPDDPAAYCAAIADRIEPGWRERNPFEEFNGTNTMKIEASLLELGVSARTAAKISEAYPFGRGLETATPTSLKSLGATAAQARRIKAAFSVVRACDDACVGMMYGRKIKKPTDVVEALRSAIGRREQEYFVVMLLDSRLRVMDTLGVAVGTLARVDVHPRDVFREAVRRNAHSIIVAHNHPSGDPEFSNGDIALTERLVEAGSIFGIPVLDSLVLTRNRSASMAELGMLPSEASPHLRAAENPDEVFVLTGRGLIVEDDPNGSRMRRASHRLSQGG
jgi:DNA repair protein RadC